MLYNLHDVQNNALFQIILCAVAEREMIERLVGRLIGFYFLLTKNLLPQHKYILG